MVGSYWAHQRLRELERERAEAERKKAGGISVPDDAEKKVEEEIVAAFEELQQRLEKHKISAEELALEAIQDFEKELIEEFVVLIGKWRKLQSKIYKIEKAVTEADHEIKEAFSYLIEAIRYHQLTVDKRSGIIFERLERRIHRKLTRMIEGWK